MKHGPRAALPQRLIRSDLSAAPAGHPCAAAGCFRVTSHACSSPQPWPDGTDAGGGAGGCSGGAHGSGRLRTPWGHPCAGGTRAAPAGC
eukprot:415114-Prymnesium_polylepis.1